MKLTGETKFIIGIIIFCIAIIAVATMFFSSPTQGLDRSDLLPKGTPIKGPEEAKVYLVEFSDFQCPACGAYKPIVDKVVEKYKDKIVFGYRHFPLPQHQFAFKAAEAAGAAGEQGKFWEMYEYLFSNQTQLSDEFIQNSGKAINLNEQKFQEALNSGKYKDEVSKDMTDGTRFGVNATPTFFLDGRKLSLTSFDDLEKAVAQEVNRL